MKATRLLPVIALAVSALTTGLLQAQVAGDFRWNGTVNDQDINAATYWQTYDGAAWGAAATAPGAGSRIVANNSTFRGQLKAASPSFSVGDVRLDIGTAAGGWSIGTAASGTAFTASFGSITTSNTNNTGFSIYRAGTAGATLNVSITGAITTSSVNSTNVDLAPSANRLDDLTVGGKITIEQAGRVTINAIGTVSLQEVAFGTTATSVARFELASANISSGGATVVRTVSATGLSGTSGKVVAKSLVSQEQSTTATLALSSSANFSAGAVLADYNSRTEPLGSATLNLSKAGSGTQILTGASTYSGTTTVNGGTLELANSSGTALGSTSGITVNSEGTLLLSQNNQINNAATVTLGGGTVNLNGKSEGAAGTTGVGALTLSATSTLDFGSTSGGNLIQFAGLGTHTGGIFQITNWEGTFGSASGTDRLLFAGAGTDFTTLYDQSQVSFNSSLGYGIQNYSGFYEVYGISAVPEPGTIAAGLALLGFVAWRERKRLKKCALGRIW